MITLFLQLTGGLCYFSNKVLFAIAERTGDNSIKEKWRIAAWILYISGVAPWVIIFVIEHNWIAASIESSGVPAMVMGLVYNWRRESNTSLDRFLDRLSKMMIIAGLGISLYDYSGITTLNQIIELVIAVCFLFGTYFLAKTRSSGYIWLLFGNGSAALLMMRQGYYILMAQQLLSTIPVSDALLSHRKRVYASRT